MQPPIPVITDTESIALIARAASVHTAYGPQEAICRDSLLIALMLEAGLRVGECAALDGTDAFTNYDPSNVLTVRAVTSKAKVNRQMPVNPQLRQALLDWRDWFSPDTKLPITGYMFRGATPNGHISTRHIESIVRKLSLAAFNRSIHPHTLRHTFATRLLPKTNLRVIQELLGHSSIQSTQVYTHPSAADLAEAINGAEDK